MANVEKNLSVETLRGIAILLVVVGHVIGSGPDGGMRSEERRVGKECRSRWSPYH